MYDQQNPERIEMDECLGCSVPLMWDESIYCAWCVEDFVVEWHDSVPTPNIWTASLSQNNS